jgi:hypothetical protein
MINFWWLFLAALFFLVSVILIFWKKRKNKNRDIALSKPTSFIVGSIDNPLIEVSCLQFEHHGKYEDIPVNDSIKANLAPIMQNVPTLVSNTAQAVANTYIVKFSPEVTKGLTDGTYHLTVGTRGGTSLVPRDVKGWVVEHPEGYSLRAVNIALAAWQVAAVVTGQKFLSDINKKLQNIEQNIDKIINILNDEKIGKVRGNFEYLQDIVKVLNQQSFTDTDIKTYDNHIEHIERECAQIMEACDRGINSAVNSLLSLPLDQFQHHPFFPDVTLSDNVENVKRQLNNLDESLMPYFMALQVRLVATQIKCALPINRKLVANRVEKLQDLIYDKSTFIENKSNEIKKHIGTLKGRWSRSDTNKYHISELNKKLDEVITPIIQNSKELRKMVDRLEINIKNQVDEYDRPMYFEVTLAPDGQISKMRKMINYEEVELQKFDKKQN